MNTFIEYSVISPLSIVMAVIWFDVFIVLCLILKKTGLITKYSVTPLILILVLCLCRLAFTIEIPGAIVIRSHSIYPALINFIEAPIADFSLFGFAVNLINIFMVVWVIGSAVLMLRYIVSYRRNNRIIDSISVARDEKAKAILLKIDPNCARINPVVCRTASINVPLIKGVIKPVILLPDVDFTDGELRAILAHEWIHYRDRDLLVNIIANVLCHVFWWNPLVYPWRRSLQLAAEMKLDFNAIVNMSKDDAMAYLSSIAKVADLDQTHQSPSDKSSNVLGLLGNSSELIERLRAMRSYKKATKTSWLIKAILYVVMTALFLASYMFVIMPYEGLPNSNDIQDNSVGEDVFDPSSQYLKKNDDGTYSLYLDGEFIMVIEDDHYFVDTLPIISK